MKILYSLLVLSFVALALSATASYDGTSGSVSLKSESPHLEITDATEGTQVVISTSEDCGYPGDNLEFDSVKKQIKGKFSSLSDLVETCLFTKGDDYVKGSEEYATWESIITVQRVGSVSSTVTQPVQVLYPKSVVFSASANVARNEFSLTVTVSSVVFDELWKITLITSTPALYTLESLNLAPSVAGAYPSLTITNPSPVDIDEEERGVASVQTWEFTVTSKAGGEPCTALDLEKDVFFIATSMCQEGSTCSDGGSSPPTADIAIDIKTADACAIHSDVVTLTTPSVSTASVQNGVEAVREVYGTSETIIFDASFTVPSFMKISGSVSSACLVANGQSSTQCGDSVQVEEVAGASDNHIKFSISASLLKGESANVEPELLYVRITYALDYSAINQKRSVLMRSSTHSILIGDKRSSSSGVSLVVPFLLAVLFAVVA